MENKQDKELKVGDKVIDLSLNEVCTIREMHDTYAVLIAPEGNYITCALSNMKSFGDDDRVNHPSHYTDGKYECIDVMEGQFGTTATANYCHLAAFKYLWRAGSKQEQGMSAEQKAAEDLKKAVWYINKEVELISKGK